MTNLLHKIWRCTLGPATDHLRDRALFHKVCRRQKSLAKHISGKRKINVIFFVLYDSMWKSDLLFRLMLESDRFNPYIVSVSYQKQEIEQRKQNQKKLELFFKKKGFPYINGFDYNQGKAFDVTSLQPDIVFYQQPYNDSEPEFRIQALYKTSLLCYIPYGIVVEKDKFFYDTFLLDSAWKLFYPTRFHLEDARNNAQNKGANVIVSGYPTADDILSGGRSDDCNCWKQKDKTIKRIIWAPHHSIMSQDMLNYSTFLDIAEDMLALAKRYDGVAQFAFKPHPVLKEKLYNIPEWGHFRTNEYYKQWASLPNCCLAEGDYIDLFNSSDAMIHDCSSFSVEYLYTLKPVMYLTKSNHQDYLNECGILCYNLHYKGCSISDIERFIEDTILGDSDCLYDERRSFVEGNLKSPGNKSVAETIFDELTKA